MASINSHAPRCPADCTSSAWRRSAESITTFSTTNLCEAFSTRPEMPINNTSCCKSPARAMRKPANKFLALGFLMATALAARVPTARASGSDAPDWLRAAAAGPLPQYPGDPKAVVLLDDETVAVQSKGDVIEHHRVAFK